VVGSLIRLPAPVQTFCAEVMRRKRDDHLASHSNPANQLLHIGSSSVFLVGYAVVFWDLTAAMWAGAIALLARQLGHAVLEPPCHDKESVLLGYTTRAKTSILAVYALIPVFHFTRASAWTMEALRPLAAVTARHWFLWTLAVVAGRVAYLVWTHGGRLATVWFVKLVTDPLTDLVAYIPRYLALPGALRSAWAARRPHP